MTAPNVLRIVDDLARDHITVWIDGGWGVDALLGRQTRSHDDLDIVVAGEALPKVIGALARLGFDRIPSVDERPWNFVLRDPNGREVDVHVIELDDTGHGIYGPPKNGDRYPAESLTGRGLIHGHSVKCISPEWQVRFHTGYAWDENDKRDVTALCEHFDLPVPQDPKQRMW